MNSSIVNLKQQLRAKEVESERKDIMIHRLRHCVGKYKEAQHKRHQTCEALEAVLEESLKAIQAQLEVSMADLSFQNVAEITYRSPGGIVIQICQALRSDIETATNFCGAIEAVLLWKYGSVVRS